MVALKDCAKRLPHPVFLRLFYAQWALRERRRRHAVMRRLGVRPLRDLRLERGSDVLFILASGASINQISAERWQAIARHDTLGLNFWLFHPFVPRFYFMENIGRAASHPMFRAFREIALQRMADYRHTLKVITELEIEGTELETACPAQWLPEVYSVDTVPVAARDLSEFRYGVSYLRAKGLFEPAERIPCLFKQASSVSIALGFAARMRYRQVVLCGVDMNHSHYFYQDRERFPVTASLEFRPRNAPHVTIAKMPWLVPLDEVILELRRQVLDPAGIELYVENQSSALWPRIQAAPEKLFTADRAHSISRA